MDALLGLLGVLLFFGGFLALMIWLGALHVKRTTERLEVVATALGLKVEGIATRFAWMRPLPEVRGMRRGRPLRIFSYTTGSGKSRTRWAAVAVPLPPGATLTFRISPQGLGSRVRSWFGAKEIEVGEPAFDQQWFVQTNAPDYLRAALLPELRARLMAVSRRGGRGTYETVDGTIRYAEQGTLSDRARCERYIDVADAVGDLADIAEVHSQQPQV